MVSMRGVTPIVGLVGRGPSGRSLLSLLAIALLSAGAAACGGASGDAGSTASTQPKRTGSATTVNAAETGPAPVVSKADADHDNDIGAPDDDTNNRLTTDVGRRASPVVARAIATAIERYYRIALAQDGATACTMVYSTVAESIPEDYGSDVGGPVYMKGTTCPVVMTKLFEHYHNQLRAEVPKLRVVDVRQIQERGGVAVLTFGAMPERRISVKREGHAWKLATLIDSELP
jgi:hypothetical protein